ncbi:MAG: hypothetical protein CSA55_03695 [Ilumatobacter coccineus]|uniref:Uncharacterized protein n=1 Tax=Ilumatobacter coccineus TaxID=467094 RepID=A0A2G6K9J2_9ACTN|nr:MAG: hypothetical protein CSA55_03695 [Ilumatobacter coccineus]
MMSDLATVGVFERHHHPTSSTDIGQGSDHIAAMGATRWPSQTKTTRPTQDWALLTAPRTTLLKDHGSILTRGCHRDDPDPRGMLPLDGLRTSRSLRRSVKRYDVTINAAVEQTIAACADPAR